MMTASTTRPPLQGPTSKEKKYDRQLRLWAASGQAALEEAHILLINSGPGVVGVEALKNLVLPGVGRYTIHDSALVTEADLGVNFFLDEDSLGRFRAEQTCNLLQELNPDVQGGYATEPIRSFLQSPDALKPYTLILANSPINPEILSTIICRAETAGTPVFYIHNVGFYSHFSLSLPHSFPIVDTHPPAESTTDLRLLKPWPALLEFASEKTRGLDQMSDHEHGHVPYALLLLHYLEKWRRSHDGNLPENYKQKTEFRDMVRQETRMNNAEGGEENFDEAVSAVLKSLNPPSASSSVKEVFGAPECQALTKGSANFWVIANAISQFFKTHAVLPLPGAVPDMKAQSADYIALQNIYKSKAREDLAEVTKIVRSLELELGRSAPIEEKEIEAFCKGAAHIKLVRGRPVKVAKASGEVIWGDRARAAAFELQNPDSLILLYIAFLAWDTFAAAHSVDKLTGTPHVPGVGANQDTDTERITQSGMAIVRNLIAEAGQEGLSGEELEEIQERLGKYAGELVRAGGAELHNIAALTGGLIAQEAIKVVTKQYIPVDNTCIFDGVTSKSWVFKI